MGHCLQHRHNHRWLQQSENAFKLGFSVFAPPHFSSIATGRPPACLGKTSDTAKHKRRQRDSVGQRGTELTASHNAKSQACTKSDAAQAHCWGVVNILLGSQCHSCEEDLCGWNVIQAVLLNTCTVLSYTLHSKIADWPYKLENTHIICLRWSNKVCQFILNSRRSIQVTIGSKTHRLLAQE